MKLFTNARAYAYDPASQTYTRSDALLVEGSKIVALGESEAGGGIERIDLVGATVLPAFADCHVHLTDTGYFLGERNLNRTRTYTQFAAAVERLPREPIIFAGQYDESFWTDGKVADAAPLDRAFPDALAMLVRVDGHSCLVNRKTLAWLNMPPDEAGIERTSSGDPTGKLFLAANWRAQARFMEAIPQRVKRDAERRAAALALAHGALHLHVQLVGFARDAYAQEIAALRDIAGPKWYPKICEPDAGVAHELGLPYVGGDVFLDGSIGSCTAAVSEPFLVGSGDRRPGLGDLKYADDELFAYFAQAHALGVSAGVHAIGDRAIEQCIATWERVLVAQPANGARHFIEHFEIARVDHIERCVQMGIYLSMQPQFDQLWGGEGRMYDTRLGTQRMRSMNALGRAQRAGAVLCGGDDSPVCELSPLQGMSAAVEHHEAQERLSAPEALSMYTYNAARLGHAESSTGRLAPGFDADFVVLDRDPLDGASFAECTVGQTWSNGKCVYDATQ
ncbi:MAG: amidohydrolase family protein [Candidatus Eremiobacteraeota bacterium]|nr:amidohydrolase family protein [Candidatus Eremiobacteraeota bacterium]